MKTRRKEILGDILRRERVIRRISQEELGKSAGVGKTTISAYELGKVSPDLEKLEFMCDRLGVDMISILSEARNQYAAETRNTI